MDGLIKALHALCPNIRRSHFHVPIIRDQLTRELTDSFLDIREEVVEAFDDVLPLDVKEGEYACLSQASSQS